LFVYVEVDVEIALRDARSEMEIGDVASSST